MSDPKRAIRRGAEALASCPPGDPSRPALLAELAEAELACGELVGAVAHWREAVAEDPSHADAPGWLVRVSRVLRPLERLEEAAEAVQRAVSLARRAAAPSRALANSLDEAGEVCSAAGDFEGAAARHAEAVGVRRAALDERDSAGALLDLSASLLRLGDAQAALGRDADAAPAYAEAVDLRRRLCARPSAGASLRGELAVALGRVGDLALRLERPEQAGGAFDEVVAVRRALYADAPGKRSGRDVAVALEGAGDAAFALGHWGGAVNRWDESVEARRRWVADYGASPEALRELSRVLDKIGDAEHSLGHFDEAAACYEESVSVRRQIAAEFGPAHDAAPAPTGAAEAAVDACRQRIAAEGADPRALEDLALALGRLALVVDGPAGVVVEARATLARVPDDAMEPARRGSLAAWFDQIAG